MCWMNYTRGTPSRLVKHNINLGHAYNMQSCMYLSNIILSLEHVEVVLHKLRYTVTRCKGSLYSTTSGERMIKYMCNFQSEYHIIPKLVKSKRILQYM